MPSYHDLVTEPALPSVGIAGEGHDCGWERGLLTVAHSRLSQLYCQKDSKKSSGYPWLSLRRTVMMLCTADG